MLLLPQVRFAEQNDMTCVSERFFSEKQQLTPDAALTSGQQPHSPLAWQHDSNVCTPSKLSRLQLTQAVCVQDDAHIFCLPSQLTAEIRGTLDLVQKTMAAFGFTQLEVWAS